MSVEGKGFFKVFVTGCLWGTIGLFVKLMEGQGSSPAYTSFLRLLFGAAVLPVLTLVLEGPEAFLVGRKTLLSCALLGIVCQGVFNLFYSRSISMNGMSVGSVLVYTAPVFTSVTSLLLFRERLNAWKWLGLLINVAGCALTYGLYFSGLQVITHTSRVPVVASVELAAAAVIGAAVFSEGITPVKMAGILLVLLSILLFSRE